MKKHNPRLYALVTLLAVSFVSTSWGQYASPSRAEKHEFSLSYHRLGGDTYTLGKVTIAEDDWSLYGINYGYNLNDYLNLNLELLYGNVAATVSGSGITGSSDQDTVIALANFDFNLVSGPLTPFITAGIGYGHTEAEAKATSGFITIEASGYGKGITYAYGAGVRWDMSDYLFAKVLYNAFNDSEETRDGFAAYVGIMFE